MDSQHPEDQKLVWEKLRKMIRIDAHDYKLQVVSCSFIGWHTTRIHKAKSWFSKGWIWNTSSVTVETRLITQYSLSVDSSRCFQYIFWFASYSLSLCSGFATYHIIIANWLLRYLVKLVLIYQLAMLVLLRHRLYTDEILNHIRFLRTSIENARYYFMKRSQCQCAT